MKSKASIKSHPIHPILIAFPIAFFTGTLFFDILGLITREQGYWQTAYFLEIAGVVFALLAAVPGFIDYLFTVPPKSSAKKRAALHGLTNVTMVALFFIAWLYREKDIAPAYWIIALEVAGTILLMIAGWMGGTLVYRNQIGVDPRYANAGKWKEAYLTESSGLIHVAAANELSTNQIKLLHVAGKRIVLARTESHYVAFDDRCTHKGGSLAGGSLMCGTVQCPWHGSQFDVQNGAVTAGPAKEDIQTYTITEKEGQVYLTI